MALEPPPPWIRRWPRDVRVGLAWTALALTVVVVIPVAITGCFLLFRFDQCASVFCGRGFRSLVAIVTIAVLTSDFSGLGALSTAYSELPRRKRCYRRFGLHALGGN